MHFKMSCFGYSDFSESSRHSNRQCILRNRKYYSAICNMASLTMYLIHKDNKLLIIYSTYSVFILTVPVPPSLSLQFTKVKHKKETIWHSCLIKQNTNLKIPKGVIRSSHIEQCEHHWKPDMNWEGPGGNVLPAPLVASVDISLWCNNQSRTDIVIILNVMLRS